MAGGEGHRVSLPHAARSAEDADMTESADPSSARVDAWLSAVRVSMTRSAATTACRAGHVRVQWRLMRKPLSRCVPVTNCACASPGSIASSSCGSRSRSASAPPLVASRHGGLATPPRDPTPIMAQRDRGAGRPTQARTARDRPAPRTRVTVSRPSVTEITDTLRNASLLAGGAALHEAQHQHDGARDEVERVQRPDRAEWQAEHVERVDDVRDVDHRDARQAVRRDVARAQGLAEHGQVARPRNTTVETVPAISGMSISPR